MKTLTYATLLFSLFFPKSYAITPNKGIVPVQGASAESKAPPQAQRTPTSENLANNSTSVREYVQEQAEKVGTPVITALWILERESQDGTNLVGDDGNSLGYWMIDREYNPVSSTCAMDLGCSTAWSLPRIKTNPNLWSTFACKYVWFYKDAVATFGQPPMGYVAPKYCGKPLQ